ncbi:HAMP domain-containing protein [Desulforegula conservatrix]|uniref:HAMP domain-containing protein n=1 Tax=Desulforegula conservatrix TaxID=153026 RepID=UPI00041CCDA7|nr:HAMP domain-containing protein [Desulforegula conservatrix]
MTLICEECGKIYHIDPEKLKSKLKGDVAKTKCHVCGHVIVITKNALDSADSGVFTDGEVQVHYSGSTSKKEIPDLDLPDSSEASGTDSLAEVKAAPESVSKPKQVRAKTLTSSATRKSGFGLRSKMFVLFLIIPILIMAATGAFTQKKLNELSEKITSESTQIITKIAEEIISDKSRAAALQCKIYLLSHPDLTTDNFNYDLEFKRISVQRIGITGYTILFERPGPDQGDEGFVIWTHPNPKLIGRPALNILKEQTGDDFPKLIKLLDRVKQGKEAGGYYRWKEKDSDFRDKYMACAPIEGTRYFIMSTAYIDEFTSQVNKLKEDTKAVTFDTLKINIAILIGAMLIMGIIITVYGYRITKNIKYLTNAADSISVGELDTEINLKSTDEIGALAEAISRMQDSLRLSIERLRKRR